MDPQVSASFIPKKPLTGEPRRRGMSGGGLIGLSSMLIFIISLIAAGAVFAYTQYLNVSLSSKKDSLEKAQSAFNTEAIEDLIRLDQRLMASKTILSKHVAASAIFSFLSAETLESVQFNKFEFALDDDRAAVLTLSGQADNFSTIALQSDQFGASKVLSDVIFSDIVITPATGKVTFTVSAKVDPDFLLYSRAIVESGAAPIMPSSSELQQSDIEIAPTESAAPLPQAPQPPAAVPPMQ